MNIDFIGKMENINDDFQKMTKILNKEKSILPEKNINKVKELNTLSEESITILKDIYKIDFETFYPESL